MEFRILGPLEVADDSGLLDLGGAKQRALLAMLLLNANSVVSRDRLIDALWEDDPPEKAQKSIQVLVSGLRKLVGKERVVTKEPGYLLRIEDGELDLARFQRLREQGRPAEALALWRGEPLVDFDLWRFAQPEIARLQDVRLGCLEERIDQDLRGGGHAQLTGELEGLVRQYPLRERLRALWMLALYRAGRQAEALAVFQDARRALVDDLGLEPGKALRDLHQAILNQDPELDLPPAQQPRPSVRAVPLPEADPAPAATAREVRKTVTVLFTGLRASSTGGQVIDPEALRRVAGRALDEVRTAIERHGGVIETTTGETISAVFGLPAVHEDDALRAVRAALEIRDSLSTLSVEVEATMLELDFGIAISTGEIVAGGGMQFGAVGEPLTRSSALGREADNGAILIDDATRRVVRDALVLGPEGEAWRVVAEARAAPATRRFSSPMVGRERERRRLRDAFDQAVGDGSCQLFTVLGPAGVGKSRLVHEFLVEIEGLALVARGRCLPYGEGITYWPLLEAIKDAVGLEDLDSPDDARAKLETRLAGEANAADVALRIAETIGLVEAPTGVENSFAAVRTLFETAARNRPVVLVFDDIHWGEPFFLDLVEHLADWTRDVPILLVCLARPDLLDVRPGWGGGKLNATSSLLEPLSESESIELIDNLAGGELTELTRQRMVEISEGNPLFVEEMLALALEDGAPADELVVPATIQSLLAARLDQLGDEERAIVDIAAVQGKVFYEEAVAALATTDASIPLGSLLHKELIRPDRPSLGGRAYRFRHLLIRDAAYESMPKEIRAELHDRFARWLDQAAGERAAEYAEIVGYHLEQAFRYRTELGTVDNRARAIAVEAAERLAAAGRRAFVRSDPSAGVNLISRAAALLPPDDPRRVDLIPNVRTVQGTDLGWAERVLTETVEAAATSGDRRLAAQALVQRGLLRLFTDTGVTPEELVEVADRAAAVFRELGDELGLTRAWRLRAQAHYLGRDLAGCQRDSELALEHARRARDRFEELEIAEWLVIALLLGPMPAPDAAQRCRALLDEIPDSLLHAQVLAALGTLLDMQDDSPAAEDCLKRSAEILEETRESVWLVPFWRSFVHIWRLDAMTAEDEVRPAYERLKQVGERTHFSSLSQMLASAVYMQGRYDEAEELVRESAEAARPNDVSSQSMWRATLAKVLARKGELAAAEELARESLAFAEGTDLLVAHAESWMDFSEVLDLAGRLDEAATAVREAIALYDQKGNAHAARTARELLAAYEKRQL